jgi:polyisoprenoid-binding protein YceI
MNKIIFILFSVVAVTALGCKGKHVSTATEVIGTDKEQPVVTTNEAKKVKVNTDASIITWKGTKMNGNGSHAGTVKMKHGELYFDKEKLTAGYFVADMNVIGVTDIPAEDSVPIRNLTNHLKGDFDVEKFPTAKFEITNVTIVTDKQMQVSGNLTIKDVTKNIRIPVQLMDPNTWHTAFKFNRLLWNVGKDGSWLEKRLVDEDVELTVTLKLLKN